MCILGVCACVHGVCVCVCVYVCVCYTWLSTCTGMYYSKQNRYSSDTECIDSETEEYILVQVVENWLCISVSVCATVCVGMCDMS